MKEKRVIFVVCLLMWISNCFVVSRVSAVSIYIFSKQNYYTTESEASLAAIVCGAGTTRNYTLRLFKSKNKIGDYNFSDSILHISIPQKSLAVGHNVYQARIFDGNKLLKDTTVDIVRLEPRSNEVKIDRETGGLIVDGLPFYPFGFYCERVGKIPEQEVANGFNFIGPYQNNLPEGLSERKKYMDRCAELGIKVQYGLNSLIGTGHNGDKGLDKTESEKLALLKQEVIAFRNHPALLSWYINDEPDGQGRSPRMLEDAYNLIHELDPYHPISIVFMMPSKFAEYGKTMDVAMTDPYPIPKSVDIRSYISQMYRDFPYQKSVWLVPQAFGGQEMWPRESTPKELRVMTYLGMLEGAKGIQYFIRLGNNLAPQSVAAWSECSNMAVEFGQMTPFLLSDEMQKTVLTDDSDIVAKEYSYKGNKLVVVVNSKNKPVQFKAHLDDNHEANEADVWFENRKVSLDGSVMTDFIDGYETLVYLIRDKKTYDKVYPGNIIYNPSFEEMSTPGLADGQGRGFHNQSKVDLEATIFTDSRQSVDGLMSLRLQTPADSAGKTVRLLPIILKAGDTYNFSIWAKALKTDKKPTLEIRIGAENLKEDFVLDSEWKKYSFMFKAGTSTTNAIVELELMNAATAWLDLVQIVPDPVVSYSIQGDKNAKVSIATISDNTEIKYSISGGPEQTYTAPVQINDAVNLKALLYKDGNKLAESSVFVPVNKALGKPVRFETPFDVQYPSVGESTLTDGIMGTTSFRDKRWLGFLQPEVVFTLDMEERTSFDSVILNFLSDANSGIFLPKNVTVSVSSDGVNFRQVASQITNFVTKRGEPSLVPLQITFDQTTARYVKFQVKTFGEIPDGYLFKGSNSWLFIDEILLK